MQNITKVSENIGHDGTHFFCLRCGKSGYDRMAQVRGHLAMCAGTAIRKGVVIPNPNPPRPQLQYTPTQPVSQPVATSYNPVATALPLNSYLPRQPVEQQQLSLVTAGQYNPSLEQRLATLENESHHMLMSRNQPSGFGDLFAQNKTLIICVAVVLFAVLLMNMNRRCDLGAVADRKSSAGEFGRKAFTKLVDKGITKGVDALFKGISR